MRGTVAVISSCDTITAQCFTKNSMTWISTKERLQKNQQPPDSPYSSNSPSYYPGTL